ncbi:hypothetical protein Tsubulata_019114 [Turnera subulata]|uniref:Factor of DNA methylation 1-5/IDN2 domain-containing protein n=1 Tax=Turnera subulata TaxID=218843 RepID=A0A9Q0GG85_9ROSI|nr:hypothetical protein Tsubulata_019114 [Turnera subulata]
MESGKEDSYSRAMEELRKARNLVVNMATEIDFKNQKLLQVEKKCDDASSNLKAVMLENARLHQANLEGTRQVEALRAQNRTLLERLVSQKDDFEQRVYRLEKQLAQNDIDCKNLVLSKETRVKELEKQLAENELNLQNMIFEMEKLKTQISVGSDPSLVADIVDLRKELEEKNEELQQNDELINILSEKERRSNKELQEARKEILVDFRDFLDGQNGIGIRRMGEVDHKPFSDACMQKFPKDWESKSVEICSLWQTHVNDPNWYPFKRVPVNGRVQEVVDRNDSKLQGLRNAWGEAAYEAIAAALMEVNEYNPSGRYIIQEIWNYKEGRKASLKEVIKFMILELKAYKTLKRKR